MKLLKKKRILVLLGITVILGAGIGGFVAWRMAKIRHSYLVARDNGFTEYKRGDSAGAIRDLGRYLSAHPQDAAALQAFAESRLRVEEPDGSHLYGAISAFRRLSDLRPESDEIRRNLVGLYARANLNTECVLTADKLLEHSPKDATLLHAKAVALLRLGKFKDSLQTIDLYLAEKTENIEAQVLRLEILSRSGPPAPNLVEAAAKVRTAHPDDMRWKLLESVACAMAGDAAGSRKWALECAAVAPPDASCARVQILQLWQTGQVSLGDAALEKAVRQFDDSGLRLLRLRRLYQVRNYQELLALTPTESDKEDESAVLRGYQCLAWAALKEPQKAEALRAELAGKAQCVLARDWATMLEYQLNASRSQSTSRTRVIQEIAQRHSREAYFFMALAAANLAEGDARSAMRAWEAAAAREVAWDEPVTRIAETLLAAGRPVEAAKVAQAAVTRAPEDRDALVVLALASARSAQDRVNRVEGEFFMSLVDKIHTKYPQEQRTMALRVSIKGQLLGKEQGIAALAETLKLQPPPSLRTLLQIAGVSRTQGLEREEDCFSTAERLYGMQPELAYARAMVLAQSGKVPAGVTLLAEAREKAAQDRQAWDIAYARYLEVNHEPEAKNVWIALGDTYPAERDVQWLVLSAPSIQADHVIAGRTIERLRALIGETGFSYKLARARWLLSADRPEASAVTEATTLLTDMCKGSPDVLEPHLLLAGCLERSGNFSGAIEQWELAANLAPDAAPILIELTRLLQNQGNMERAGFFLEKLTKHAELTGVERQKIAGLLARQGQPDRAIAFLEAGLTSSSEPEAVKLMLAALYAQRGQTAKAQALFDELMKQPNLLVVRLAAAFYASHNRLRDAEQAMARLDELKLEPATLATEQGDFAARFGKPQEAVAAYQKALQAAPGEVQIWYRLIGSYLQQGQGKEAQESIQQALVKVPSDKILAALHKNEPFVEALSGDVRSRPILLSLITAPQHGEAAEAVLARLQKSRGGAAPDMQLAIDISRLADRYPQYAALQNLAVDLDVSQGRLEDATTIATRAMQTFPASAEPARLAAAAFAAAGNRWSETLGASNQWRARAPEQTLAPDVMIGLSYLGLGRPDDTLRQIEPYMAEAVNDPDRYASVIVLYARSELAKNHVANAQEKLWALAKASKRGLATFIQIAGHEAPVAAAEQWLNVAPQELKDDMDLQLVFVPAVADYSRRAGNTKLMDVALQDMQKLAASSKDQPEKLSLAHLAIGMIQEGQKSPAAAEASYRRALELNPKAAAACNNLAMVLARRGALPEALIYARQAVSLAPQVANFQDTLAFVQDKSGDHANAIEHLRTAMQLQPENPEWRINLAQTYVNAGQNDKARSTLVNSDGAPYRPVQLEDKLRDKLSALQQQLGIRL